MGKLAAGVGQLPDNISYDHFVPVFGMLMANAPEEMVKGAFASFSEGGDTFSKVKLLKLFA